MERKQKRELLSRLNRDAERIAVAFGLRYRAVEAERANVKNRYGICYSDGTIRIRLNHAVSRRPLKYSSLVNTLCHELAHLRYFNHGERFQRFYSRILEWARADGIYTPGTLDVAPPRQPRPAAARTHTAAPSQAPEQPTAPVQLSLFG